MRKKIELKQCRMPRGVFEQPCKVYHDGNHFVAVPVLPKKCKKSYPKGSDCLSNERAYFDMHYGDLLASGIKPTARKLFAPLYDAVVGEYPDMSNPDEFVTVNIKRQRHNYFSRMKRLVRKANLNIWNKWVTITYDPNIHDEYTFRTKLKKCLSNLHTRHGWRYMGVFERSPEENRLHFHAVMYVPENEMVGQVREIRDWSTAKHCMQITHSNSFFAKKFGRNDFEELNEIDLTMGHTIEYLTKYISKTNERITYSRGIPTELTVYVEKRDIATVYMDYVTKCVLFDDCIDKVGGYVPSAVPKYGQLHFDDYVASA